jgi:hypothetical protein
MPDSFWRRVRKTGSCWLWLGAKDRLGYGSVRHDGKIWGAHRLSWFLTYGKITNKEVRHTCDIRACVRPSHLVLGTHQQNMTDMQKRGRGTWKVTLNQIEQIRSTKGTQTLIARKFKLHQSTVSLIKRNKYPYRRQDLENVSNR